MNAGKEKLLGVQYLRAIAALLVVWHHLYGEIPAYEPFLSAHGWISVAAFRGGVDIFFVISGFVMYVSSIDAEPRRFLWRRLARIAPLYWIMTLVVVVLSLGAHSLAQRTEFSWEYLAKSFAFIPYANPGHAGEVYPLLVPGWSLNYEMFFYAVFAATLLLECRWRLLAVLTTLCTLVVAGMVLGDSGPIAATYTSPLLVLFGAGMILGYFYSKRRVVFAPLVRNRWIAVSMIVSGFVLLGGPWSGGEPDLFVSAILIVLGVVALDVSGMTPHWAFLALLGDASYSLYLDHTFMLSITRVIWEHLRLNSALAFAALSVAGSVALAVLTYRVIERPTLRLLTQPRRVTEIQEATAS